MTPVAAFLARVANDEAFRDLLERDPDAALGEYDLPDEVRELARRRDAGALALLSWENIAGGVPGPPVERARTALPDLDLGRPMPPIEMVLRLVPTRVTGPDGAEHLAHAASLHPAPAPGEPLAGLAPGDDAGALFAIRVSPLATPHPDGLIQLGYAASIAPLGATADPGLVPDTSVPTNPWGHRRDAAAQAAAVRVREAAPEARYEALLALIGAITGEDGR